MQLSQVLNNKEKGRPLGACSHVHTFEKVNSAIVLICVKCGRSETVRYFD